MKKILDDSKTSEEKASIDTWRFITAASTGPVKEACAMHAIIGSKLDSVYYDHCLRVSKRWTRMLPKSLKGRRIRVYRQAKDVAHILCNMPSEANWISNADISKMFERLPRNGLLSIKSTCAWKFRLCLQEKRVACVWVHMSSKAVCYSNSPHRPPYNMYGWTCVTPETYDNLLAHILKYAVIRLGDALFVQTLGVPMGFDDSPYMSQTFFDYLDYDYAAQAVKNKE